MKILISVFTLSLMFAASAIIADGQTKAAEPNAPAIETSYDEKTNETEIELTQLPISVDKSALAFVNLSVSFKGNKLKTKPDDLFFIISVVSNGGKRYANSNDTTFKNGDKSIGSIIMLNLDQRAYNETQTLETLGTRMPMGTFKKLMAAPSVSFKIGDATFAVDTKTIARFIEFDKAITP